jgi:hypothetical protein
LNISHIPLAQRKTICGRLLFFEVAYPDRMKFLVTGVESEFDQVRNNVFSLTEQAASSSADSEPLDQFLKRLNTDLGYQMRPQLWGKHASLFQGLYLRITQKMVSLSCTQCSPIRPSICDGGEKDDEVVRTGGECIAPIRQMFDIASHVSEQWYVKFSNLFSPQQRPNLVLSTSFSNDKPSDIPGDYFLGGATHHSNEVPPVANVELTLCLPKFDWNTYAAILYVLFHECFCHAYQKMIAFRPNPLSDGFYEGWMDWIAFECFARHLRASPKSFTLQAYLDAGTKLHLLRVDYNHPKKSSDSAIRAFGRSVAQKFLTLLERLPESSADPWSSLLMSSFDMNLAGGISDQELAALDSCLPEKEHLDSPRLEGLTDAVRNYIQSKDISIFFEFLAGSI